MDSGSYLVPTERSLHEWAGMYSGTEQLVRKLRNGLYKICIEEELPRLSVSERLAYPRQELLDSLAARVLLAKFVVKDAAIHGAHGDIERRGVTFGSGTLSASLGSPGGFHTLVNSFLKHKQLRWRLPETEFVRVLVSCLDKTELADASFGLVENEARHLHQHFAGAKILSGFSPDLEVVSILSYHQP
jgi:hypothetical protein